MKRRNKNLFMGVVRKVEVYIIFERFSEAIFLSIRMFIKFSPVGRDTAYGYTIRCIPQ